MCRLRPGNLPFIYFHWHKQKIRTLFKMDFAEAAYVSELRSAPAGHFSYREVAWEMYLAVQRQHPPLARYFRVTDFTEPVDLFKR